MEIMSEYLFGKNTRKNNEDRALLNTDWQVVGRMYMLSSKLLFQ